VAEEPLPAGSPAAPAPEAITPVATPGVVEPSPPSRHTAGNTHCLNCGTKLAGPYCHACGQHDFDVHRSFGHALMDALENLFHFEGKFFRNVVTLLFRPGRLSVDFNAGRRASQMPPFRLYLFVSLAFFGLTFLDRNTAGAFKLGPQRGAPAQITVDGRPATIAEALSGQPGEPPAAQAPDPAPPPAAVQSDWQRRLEERSRRALDPAVQREMTVTFLHSLPKLLLFCLPLFALWTRLLWRKSGQAYLQHLVVALHFHTFIFLWVLCRDGWTFLAGFAGSGLARGLGLVCNLWLILYPVLMLRRIFAQGWLLSFAKAFVLFIAYTFTLATGFLIAGFVIIFLL
jgi:hypothetical protein